MSPGPAPEHWLHRLTAEEWLRAAENEVALAFEQLRSKRRREGLTYARRAAGMALNGLLCRLAPDPAAPELIERWGRSYMDHLKALRVHEAAPEAVRTSAGALLDAPMNTNVVPLGPGPTELAEAADRVFAWAKGGTSEG